MTSTIVDRKVLDPNRVPFAVNSHHTWEQLRFTGIENPHILIAGGSQTGKTTLQILIAAVAASRGCIVLILDPKLRFSRPFRHPVTQEPLPNVLVYRHQDPDVAACEWDGVLEMVVREMQRRYQLDDESPTSILADQTRFPTVLVVCDELGTLLDFADKEWPHRKPDDYKGATPVREHTHTLTRMGAESRFIGCFANQTASEKEMPAGTRTRQLCGQRIVLGGMKEGSQWRMIAGEGVGSVPVPDNQKGAGVLMIGDGNPERIQCGFIDWQKHPEHVYDLAAQGVPILREQGHIDEAGRLLLGGNPVPRPGKMSKHVTSGGVDLPTQQDPSTAAETVRDSMQETTQPEPVTEYVIGNEAGAEFCGMSVGNFRRHRDRNPIPGEVANHQGNKPAWDKADLREWAMLRFENRRDKSTSEKGGK